MSKLNKLLEAGRIIITDPSSDKPILEIGTKSCCHCGGQWISQPGSGITRGYCMRCRGYVCGLSCQACVPLEQMIENIEKGRPLDFVPICVPTS